MENLKTSKGKSEYVNRRRTDNTIAKRKRAKKKTMIYKILYRKLKVEQHEHHLKSRVNSGAPEGQVIPAQNVTPVVLF